MAKSYRLKKSLGQHFLKDEVVCREIVDQIPKGELKQLLEVGPGGGALTKYLLAIADWDYKAVELDEEKVVYLLQQYPSLKDKLFQGDFLKMEAPFQGRFMMVGNFPYNISGPVFFKILEWELQVESVVGMFQKEVAQRVASSSGTKVYGILSVLIQVYYKVEYLFDVAPDCFMPPPKVVSGVIRLTRTNNPYKIQNKKKFIGFVKASFSQRRKTLKNALKGFIPENKLPDQYAQKRAEQLSVPEFVNLYNILFEQNVAT